MKWVLAPLAGFTDAPFRRLCHEGGAELCHTEMVSAAAIAHGHAPSELLLATMPGEGAVSCQLFGANESDLAIAVREISKRHPTDFVSFDLNAGCPMTKVTRCGAGAALVRDPEKIHRLLKAMRENSPLPITLKTRLGPHPEATTIFEIIDAAASAGAAALTVHARYTSQLHGGEVHYDTLSEVVRRSPLPVTGNGSVTDRASAKRMSDTGVSAIMIGRAALADPSIFARLKGEGATLATQECFERHLEYLLKFRDELSVAFPNAHVPSVDGYASVKMHTHLFRYFNGRPGAAALRARLNRVRTLAEIRKIAAAQWQSM